MEMLDLVNKIQAQLIAVEMKIDTLIGRAMGAPRPSPKPPVNNKPERPTYKAICADCRKECTIPFKPSGDRPVYCQDCFSRRKVMRLSGMKIEEKPPQASVEPPPVPAKKKKAAAVKAVKKAPAKKRVSPKRK